MQAVITKSNRFTIIKMDKLSISICRFCLYSSSKKDLVDGLCAECIEFLDSCNKEEEEEYEIERTGDFGASF